MIRFEFLHSKELRLVMNDEVDLSVLPKIFIRVLSSSDKEMSTLVRFAVGDFEFTFDYFYFMIVSNPFDTLGSTKN